MAERSICINIIGPPGHGKSTIAATIAKQLRALGVVVAVDEEDTPHMRPHASDRLWDSYLKSAQTVPFNEPMDVLISTYQYRGPSIPGLGPKRISEPN